MKENGNIIVTFRRVFLVGAFPLREKFPTIAVTVFFQTTILTLIGPLFRNNPETTYGAQSGKGAKANLLQRVPPFIFLLFQGNLQNRPRLKGHLF